jgi:hypothetical protein
MIRSSRYPSDTGMIQDDRTVRLMPVVPGTTAAFEKRQLETYNAKIPVRESWSVPQRERARLGGGGTSSNSYDRAYPLFLYLEVEE